MNYLGLCGAVLMSVMLIGPLYAKKQEAEIPEKKTEAPSKQDDRAEDIESGESPAKLTFGPNRWIAFHLLLQPQARFAGIYEENVETSRDGIIQKELFLKRCRLIFNGNVTKNISFFVETEDWEAGRNGSNTKTGAYTTGTGTTSKETGYDGVDPTIKHKHTVTVEDSNKNNVFTQTAIINYRLFDWMQFAVGIMPLPFTRQNLQSAASLLGVDYQTAFVDSAIGGSTNNWRDTGLEMRGFLFGGVLDYKVGVFKGIPRSIERDENGVVVGITNPHDNPRYSGRIQINFLEPETGFFYSENYLGRKKIIALGGGMDYQQHVYRRWFNDGNSDLLNYTAWTVDFSIDYGFRGGNALAFQGGYIATDNNPQTASYVTNRYYDSTAFYAQAGFLFKRLVQPVIKYYSVYQKDVETDPDNPDVKSSQTYAHFILGLNFYIQEHNANIKMEYSYPNGDNNRASGQKWFAIQCQLFL